jgi:hypothetical protein
MPKLYLSDGIASSNTANVETQIWEMTVPRGYVRELTTLPLYAFFVTKDTFTAGGGAPEVFTLTGDVVDSPNLGDNMGTVWVYKNGTLVTTGVTVDYAANTVSLNAAGADVIEVYYVFGNGNVKIYAYTPEENRKLLLWNGRIENFHVADQYDTKIAQRLKNIAPLAEDFKIKILLKSSSVVVSATADLAEAKNYILEIPYNEFPIEKYPKEALKNFVDSMI